MNVYPCLISIKLCGLQNTLTLSAENLNEIASTVFGIWPGKVKSRGAHLIKQARSFSKIQYLSNIVKYTGVPLNQDCLSAKTSF